MAEKKEKRYVSDDAQLMSEWDLERNGDVLPSETSLWSHRKIWWKCERGHYWDATPHHRSYGTGCPYCSGKRVKAGYNDLATLFPEIGLEWNSEKNGDLHANAVSPSSNKRVWWKCKCDHEWQSVIASRTHGVGCPYCANKKVLVGFNDFATTHPELASEWHPSKNGNLKPEDITRGAGISIWWQCALGHEWIATPNKRTSSGTACPYCSNKKVLRGFNDLATTNPRLAKEWHPTQNGDLTPYDIVEGSARKIWWLCDKGHVWQATPYNRIKNRNCPICSKQLRTSFPEQALFYYVKRYFQDAENSNDTAISMELDIYIPSLKSAIEYDGVYYHDSEDSKLREVRKNRLCKENGIRLIRVREAGLDDYDDCICITEAIPNNIAVISHTIAVVLQILGVNDIIVDIEADLPEILSSYLSSEHTRNLLALNPMLASEWHPVKNGKLKPEHLALNSGKKVWWKCSKGHEWQASLHNRSRGKGCPYCSGRVAISGENDLLTLDPRLVREWDYELNNPLQPTDVKSGSNEKVWWICATCAHKWKTAINARTAGRGCPKCGEQKKGPKRKSHEQFVAELYSVNPKIQLCGNYVVSTKKVECRCLICQHEWTAFPGNLLKGKGCPACARKRGKKE